MARIAYLNYVAAKGSCRWDELITKFNLGGDEEYIIEEYNIVLWTGISKEFKESLDAGLKLGKISFALTDISTYQLAKIKVDKGYPIGKNIPETGYKELRWVPTIITAKV